MSIKASFIVLKIAYLLIIQRGPRFIISFIKMKFKIKRIGKNIPKILVKIVLMNI